MLGMYLGSVGEMLRPVASEIAVAPVLSDADKRWGKGTHFMRVGGAYQANVPGLANEQPRLLCRFPPAAATRRILPWVESRRAGFLASPCAPSRLQDPIAVFSEKAKTIPQLTHCRRAR